MGNSPSQCDCGGISNLLAGNFCKCSAEAGNIRRRTDADYEVARSVAPHLGGLALLLRCSAWVAHQLIWLDQPLVVPAVIVVSLLAGLTPWSFIRGFQWAFRALGANGLADTTQVSTDVVNNIWFWRIIAMLILWQFGTYICARRNFPLPFT